MTLLLLLLLTQLCHSVLILPLHGCLPNYTGPGIMSDGTFSAWWSLCGDAVKHELCCPCDWQLIDQDVTPTFIYEFPFEFLCECGLNSSAIEICRGRLATQ